MNFKNLPSFLRRDIALLRKMGQSRPAALFNAINKRGNDVASATTISLKVPFCNVTGSVTITGIAPAADGNPRKVKFTGSPGLTHNGVSFILPGAVSRTAAPGDIAEFTCYDGTNWQCTAYTLADGTPLAIVPIAKGGTGQTTAVTAIDALHTQSTDIASASSVDLSTATGQYANITGTTTITAFTGLAAGVKRQVTFTGVLVLTHNATSLKIPGAANILTAAGDRCTVTGLGSSNVEISSYVRAAPSPLSATPLFYPNVRIGLISVVRPNPGSLFTKSTIYAGPWMGNNCTHWNGTEFISLVFPSLSIALSQSQTGATHNGTKVIDGLSDTSQLMRNMKVTGTNVGAGAVISSVDSATQVTVSVASTGSASNTITFQVPSGKNVDIYSTLLTGVGSTTILSSPVLRGDIWGADINGGNGTVDQFTGGGVYVNTVDVGSPDYNGIHARSTYLGTIRTSADGQTEDSSQKRFVWNAYNRRLLPMVNTTETTGTWNYSTAAYQQANANTANKIEFVVGVLEDEITASVRHMCVNSTATARLVHAGIGLSSTTANSAQLVDEIHVISGQRKCMTAEYRGYPASQGYYYLAWLEYGAGTVDTQTWVGQTAAGGQSGITGFLMG